MTSLQEFRCEVCGLVTTNPIHWFVIRPEVYIRRWFDSVCAPPEPSFA